MPRVAGPTQEGVAKAPAGAQFPQSYGAHGPDSSSSSDRSPLPSTTLVLPGIRFTICPRPANSHYFGAGLWRHPRKAGQRGRERNSYLFAGRRIRILAAMRGAACAYLGHASSFAPCCNCRTSSRSAGGISQAGISAFAQASNFGGNSS